MFIFSSISCSLFQSAKKINPWLQRNEVISTVSENHKMLGRPSLIGLPGHTDSGMHIPSGSELNVALEVSSTPAERGNSNSAKGGGSGGGDGRTELDVICNTEEENYETDCSKMS
jgi:hypothetical protein